MDGSRTIPLSLEKFIKRSWPLLVLGAVLIIAASIALVWLAVSGRTRLSRAPESTSAAESPIGNATSTSALVPRALDGVLVDPVEARLQPYAVMVENAVEARPLAGPASANLVFEAPVEGGITRYLVVFDATTTVDAIGPVRSARPYFVDFADSLNAVYAHVGGSPEALDRISRMSAFRDVNEFFSAKYFWRSTKRSAPHNVYTRSDLLQDMSAAKKWPVGHFRPWSFKDDAPMEATSTFAARGGKDGPRIEYGGTYTVNLKFDRSTNAYTRVQGGSIQKDQDGSVVTAKNIIVLHTEGSAVDAVGRLKIRTTGKGKATLYRDGDSSALQWGRSSGEAFAFQTVDGVDAMFNRGTTWIEIVLDSSTSTK